MVTAHGKVRVAAGDGFFECAFRAYGLRARIIHVGLYSLRTMENGGSGLDGRQLALQEQVDQYFSAPFRPAGQLEAQYRVANALEYIAAAMGRISERLESIDRSLSSQSKVAP